MCAATLLVNKTGQHFLEGGSWRPPQLPTRQQKNTTQTRRATQNVQPPPTKGGLALPAKKLGGCHHYRLCVITFSSGGRKSRRDNTTQHNNCPPETRGGLEPTAKVVERTRQLSTLTMCKVPARSLITYSHRHHYSLCHHFHHHYHHSPHHRTLKTPRPAPLGPPGIRLSA